MKLGERKKVTKYFTAWGGAVTEIWLFRDCRHKDKKVYGVMGLFKDENGRCLGWGDLFAGSLAECRKYANTLE